MRAIPTTNPRRQPRQARAQATVDAIVKATAHVLIDEGYDRASTNRIAQAAGVSIGSLYQYFPSKEALVAALVDSHVEKMTHALDATLGAHEPQGISANARTLVRGLIAAYRVEPDLHHVLCQEVPKIGELEKVYSFEQQLGQLCRQYLFVAHENIRCTDVDRAIFTLVNAVPSVARAAVQADPAGEQDGRLTEELTDLILRYVLIDPPN